VSPVTVNLNLKINAFCARCGMPLDGKQDGFGNMQVEPCRVCVAKAIERAQQKERAA